MLFIEHPIRDRPKEPGMNDALYGRGGGTNNHVGNVRFRHLINGHKLRYLAATKSEKPMIAREVVAIWRNLKPPGRFLEQKTSKYAGENNIQWKDVGDKKAREKTSQCLRERTPDVVSFVKQLELQSYLEQQEKEAQFTTSRGATVPNNAIGGLKSSEIISQHLLLLQKQAAITAHTFLNTEIPPVIAPNRFESTFLPLNRPLISPASSSSSSSASVIAMQQEQINKEIDFLEREKARLEADIEKEELARLDTEPKPLSRANDGNSHFKTKCRNNCTPSISGKRRSKSLPHSDSNYKASKKTRRDTVI